MARTALPVTTAYNSGAAPTATAVDPTNGHVIADDTFAQLKSSFDAKAITELVMTVGFYNGVIKILATLEIDVEEEYLIYLEKFPLPVDQVAQN